MTKAPNTLRSQLCIALGAGLVLTGCYDQLVVEDESDGRLTVTNDEEVLNDRVTFPGTDVPILTTTPTQALNGPAGAPARIPSSIALTLIAEVLPLTVGGQVLQATSVWATLDDKAIVSYNVRGPAARGGLDFFTKLRNGNPRLTSSVTFADADVNAVMTDGTWAYAALATEDITYPAPALLERIKLQGEKFSLDDNLIMPLTSFAGTGAMATNREVYATSGDGGDVFAFDDGDLTLLGQYALDDARWVAWDEDNNRVVVAQGTPGRLSVFAEGDFPGGSMTLLNTFPYPGADVPESKTTVEIVGGKAFVAAGAEGVQIICLDNGLVVGTVPRPDPASLGLDPSVVVTNAVTVEDDLLFISNGEAGVYAAAGAEDFADTACSAPQNITMFGQLQFDALQSANHVVYRNNRLFVAAGLGGIKIVDVDVTN